MVWFYMPIFLYSNICSVNICLFLVPSKSEFPIKIKIKKKKRQTEITNQVISNLALIRRSRLLIQPTFFSFLFLPLSSK